MQTYSNEIIKNFFQMDLQVQNIFLFLFLFLNEKIGRFDEPSRSKLIRFRKHPLLIINAVNKSIMHSLIHP